MRSDTIKRGDARAPHRSLLRATGVGTEDFDKPFIAVCNSYTDIIPGHVHLDKVGRLVKQCVAEAGAVPFVFNTIGVDDGIAMGHEGMKFSLPSRELIADAVETMLRAHCFDGMICIPNCDKIVPGMLMAAVRLNIPTIFVSGGPMAAGRTKDGKAVDLISIGEGVAAHKIGKIFRVQKMGSLMDPFNRQELSIFLNTVKDHFPKHFPLVLTLARTGMRLGEALGLQWGDIDFNSRFITVQRGLSKEG